MSRKRYGSGSQRWNPNQGQQNSTSTQLASQDDSLTAECLIRTFMEKGDSEDPILKVLFVGGSKPKENETEKDLLFRRMKNCWMEKGKGYGMKELLKTKMKEVGIETEIDGKWAKFQLMGAPLIISPKIWVTKQGEEKRFLKDFQLENFVTIGFYQKPQSESKSMGMQIPYQNQSMGPIPDKEPAHLGSGSKKIFHLIMDDCEVLHHVIINGGQQGYLDQYYNCQHKETIQLIQQDWSQYICMIRGRQKIFQAKERKVQQREKSTENRYLRKYFNNQRSKERINPRKNEQRRSLRSGFIEEQR